MRISPARVEDLSRVIAMEREIAEAPHWSIGEYEAIIRADASCSVERCLMLAWLDAEIVGYAVGRLAANEAELESVAVQSSSRRRGVARMLCEAIILWAWGRGAQWIDLEVRSASSGANELYDQLGFVEVGRRPRYYTDPVDDAILRRLARPASEERPIPVKTSEL